VPARAQLADGSVQRLALVVRADHESHACIKALRGPRGRAAQRWERLLRTRGDSTPARRVIQVLPVHPLRAVFRPIERAVLGALMTLVAVVLDRRLRARQR
jgi:hypothetical protein